MGVYFRDLPLKSSLGPFQLILKNYFLLNIKTKCSHKVFWMLQSSGIGGNKIILVNFIGPRQSQRWFRNPSAFPVPSPWHQPVVSAGFIFVVSATDSYWHHGRALLLGFLTQDSNFSKKLLLRKFSYYPGEKKNPLG